LHCTTAPGYDDIDENLGCAIILFLFGLHT
jgi:hypothetical protein